MEGSALTDYIFPQRKLELIWPVTHMPGCQLQHTTPDSTPHRAQLAPALPAHRCGPQGPSSERQGSGGQRARRVRGSWWYFRTRRAHARPRGSTRIYAHTRHRARGTRIHTRARSGRRENTLAPGPSVNRSVVSSPNAGENPMTGPQY